MFTRMMTKLIRIIYVEIDVNLSEIPLEWLGWLFKSSGGNEIIRVNTLNTTLICTIYTIIIYIYAASWCEIVLP